MERIHPPGARIVICSDGHVFGDVVHVPDAHIDAYADELRGLISGLGLTRLSVFDLRDVLGDLPYDRKRAHIHRHHAPGVDALRAEVHADDQVRALYRGITRFLVEDTADFPGTRSALQRACRQRAYGVLQRSRAWGALIAEHHPAAVRLSIHPPAGRHREVRHPPPGRAGRSTADRATSIRGEPVCRRSPAPVASPNARGAGDQVRRPDAAPSTGPTRPRWPARDDRIRRTRSAAAGCQAS
ncbi:L-tyrosine/L-tryptophan isonitrile synthase family protein [Streptomyces yokosukanensis]|uniref:L-tyrosine/L-tryptophan isonitrile synthase family protein n=1 Tax=Streptomyces yokosukanensis TaxID=67386 RepID=UPI003CC69DF0